MKNDKKTNTAYGFVQFTPTELPHKNRSILRKICHNAVFIKEVDSNGTCSYRVQAYYNGYKIDVTATTSLAEAKQQLIEQALIAINGENK